MTLEKFLAIIAAVLGVLIFVLGVLVGMIIQKYRLSQTGSEAS